MQLAKTRVLENVKLLYNFMQLASGVLMIDAKALHYTGMIMDRETCLVIPMGRLTNNSVKVVDESFLVLLTVQDTEFFQLSVDSGIVWATYDLEAVAEEIAEMLKQCIKETNQENHTLDTDDSREMDEYEALRADIIRVCDEEIAMANEKAGNALAELESRFQAACPENETRKDEELNVEAGQCNICCDGIESCEFEPCGHRVCESCLGRLAMTEGGLVICPWDRKDVECIKSRISKDFGL
jgi:hypothetical protein